MNGNFQNSLTEVKLKDKTLYTQNTGEKTISTPDFWSIRRRYLTLEAVRFCNNLPEGIMGTK